MNQRVRGRVLRCDRDELVLLIRTGDAVHLRSVRSLNLTPGDLIDATLRDGLIDQIDNVVHPMRTGFPRGGELGGNPAVRLRRVRARAHAISTVRTYLTEEGFLEVDTPCVVRSPGLDQHLAAFSVLGSHGRPQGHLITSPEYHLKRLVVAGVGHCFQFTHCFRDDELGDRHEPEFMMLEWYQPWDDLGAMQKVTQSIVRRVCETGADPGFLRLGEERVPVSGEFELLTVREAFARYASSSEDPVDVVRRDEAEFHHVMTTEIEPRLGFERPVFLHRYPSEVASLSRRCSDDPTVCARFELYALGIELCNGFDELTDPAEQRSRLEADFRRRALCGLPVLPVDERFLGALEEGMPPTVGNALGFDRLLALALGCERISDVMNFSAGTV